MAKIEIVRRGDARRSKLYFLRGRVGKVGVSEGKRRLILRREFEEELWDYGPPEYIAQWGEPRSPERLRKMAESVASCARNMKCKNVASEEAINHWEADIAWLKEQFHNRKMQFVWPSTSPYGERPELSRSRV